ncbi:MAG TPA: hypothetical protein VFN10_20110, partial [Thermoanaerobaculia bacterium]|nr:hypothetical protein [Thermoanaerobaculia bacterium]
MSLARYAQVTRRLTHDRLRAQFARLRWSVNQLARAARLSWQSAARVLRAERSRADAFASHADRTLRTSTARRCATDAYELVRSGNALEKLVSRPCWSRIDANHFVCTFGSRRTMMTVPSSQT